MDHTLLDGSHVWFESPGGSLDLTTAPSIAWVVRVQSDEFEFVCGPKGWASDVAEDHGVALTQSQTRWGPLLVGTGEIVETGAETESQIRQAGGDLGDRPPLPDITYESSWLVYEGREYSLYTQTMGPQGIERLLAFLRPIDIVEEPGGVVLRHKNGMSPDRDPYLMKEIDDVGLVIVQPNRGGRKSDRTMTRGTPVLGGNLFFDSDKDRPYFALANESSITTIVPSDSAERSLPGVQDLVVEWRAQSEETVGGGL